jgi:hypothetical protein
MKGVNFRLIVRLHICDSVWSGLPTLFFDVADGGFFHD